MTIQQTSITSNSTIFGHGCRGSRWVLLICLVAALSPACLPPLSDFIIYGEVVGCRPIQDAEVELWTIDSDGNRRTTMPIVTARTDENGRFVIDIDKDYLTHNREFYDSPFLFRARGGITSEYWLGNADLDFGLVHSEALLYHFDQFRPGIVVLSPLTTLAKALGEARMDAGKAGRYQDAMTEAHALLANHFQVWDLVRQEPDLPLKDFIDGDGMHYGLVIYAMSALSQKIATESFDPTYRIHDLTEALIADVDGPLAIFDGFGLNGTPIMLGAVNASVDTLRGDLGSALSEYFLQSPIYNDTPLEYPDMAFLFDTMAASTEPELFGEGVVAAPVETDSPEIEIQPTTMVDERFDSVEFDLSKRPLHSHNSTYEVDITEVFTTGFCPDIYKHTNLMVGDDNPLRWRFVIRDQVVGVNHETVKLIVQPPGTTVGGIDLPLVRVASDTYEVAVTSDRVPELATREGRFNVILWVEDWLGNEKMMSGCWNNKPLAPPLWVSEPWQPDMPGSMTHDFTLAGQNNLATLINGDLPEFGKGVMAFEVINGSSAPAYITLNYSQPDARYTKTWIHGYTLLYVCDEMSSCINKTCLMDGTCVHYLDIALDPVTHHNVQGTLGSDLITGVRIWDETGPTPSEIVMSCDGCDTHEYLLSGRDEETGPRKYLIMLVASHVPELAPRTPDEPTTIWDDIPVHLIYQPATITGALEETVRVCYRFLMPFCIEERIFQRDRFLASATLNTASIDVQGLIRPALTTSHYTPPYTQEHRFGGLLRLSSFEWATEEDTATIDKIVYRTEQ